MRCMWLINDDVESQYTYIESLCFFNFGYDNCLYKDKGWCKWGFHSHKVITSGDICVPPNMATWMYTPVYTPYSLSKYLEEMLQFVKCFRGGQEQNFSFRTYLLDCHPSSIDVFTLGSCIEKTCSASGTCFNDVDSSVHVNYFWLTLKCRLAGE